MNIDLSPPLFTVNGKTLEETLLNASAKPSSTEPSKTAETSKIPPPEVLIEDHDDNTTVITTIERDLIPKSFSDYYKSFSYPTLKPFEPLFGRIYDTSVSSLKGPTDYINLLDTNLIILKKAKSSLRIIHNTKVFPTDEFSTFFTISCLHKFTKEIQYATFSHYQFSQFNKDKEITDIKTFLEMKEESEIYSIKEGRKNLDIPPFLVVPPPLWTFFIDNVHLPTETIIMNLADHVNQYTARTKEEPSELFHHIFNFLYRSTKTDFPILLDIDYEGPKINDIEKFHKDFQHRVFKFVVTSDAHHPIRAPTPLIDPIQDAQLRLFNTMVDKLENSSSEKTSKEKKLLRLQPFTSRLITNASSLDGIKPRPASINICNFLDQKNAMAAQTLLLHDIRTQMGVLGSISLSSVAAMHSGFINRLQADVPKGLSIFFLGDQSHPRLQTANEQTILLHQKYNFNVKLSVDDLHKITDDILLIPSSLDAMITAFKTLEAIAIYFFGDNTILALKVKVVIDHYLVNSDYWNAALRSDPYFIAKFIWIFDCAMAAWLNECASKESPLEVDHSLLDMTTHLRNIKLNSFVASLPDKFVKLVQSDSHSKNSQYGNGTSKNSSSQGNNNTGTRNLQGKRNREDRHSYGSTNSNERTPNSKITNTKPIQAWIIPDEEYKNKIQKNHDAKLLRPKFREKFICHRFSCRGYCFDNCHLSDHTPSQDLPQQVQNEFTTWLNNIRRISSSKAPETGKSPKQRNSDIHRQPTPKRIKTSPPTPIFHPDVWYPTNLIEIAEYIVSQPEWKPLQSEFSFDYSDSAASQNWELISSKYGFDLKLAISKQQNTAVQIGSEFKPSHLWELIFQRHPFWTRTKRILDQGTSYDLLPLSNEQRLIDVKAAISYGNHKGLLKQSELFRKMIVKEVNQGYAIPLPLHEITNLPGALISPMNIHAHIGVLESGEFAEKPRLTHDQSFSYINGNNLSFNDRVIAENLPPCIFGKTLKRVLHQICAIRLNHPNKKIFLAKFDIKSAYRRIHLNPDIAIQTITMDTEANLALLWLRQTFGGKPHPNEWGMIAEPITDLANALISLNVDIPEAITSPYQSMIPPEKSLPIEIPFAEALPFEFNYPARDASTDLYIDDQALTCLDDSVLKERASKAVLSALFIVARSLHSEESIPRFPLTSIEKLLPEGFLTEEINFLGWIINTRSLTIHLQKHKLKAWSSVITKIIEKKKTTKKELESTIGRLETTCQIIPSQGHFMNRLRSRLYDSPNLPKNLYFNLNQTEIDDLNLHLKFLTLASEGININLLTRRAPSLAWRTDACPWGIGGYSNRGRAFRWLIPPEHRFKLHINALEFLASTLGPRIDAHEGNLPPLSRILSQTDNTTAEGWIWRTNFSRNNKDEDPSVTNAKESIARSFALSNLQNKVSNHSSYIAGEQNDIADSLSRDHHLDDHVLTKLLVNSFPLDLPQGFRIQPIPVPIISEILSILSTIHATQPTAEKPKPSKLALGKLGFHSFNEADLKTTSWLTLTKNQNLLSSQPSLNLSASDILKKMTAHHYEEIQSNNTSTKLYRPSESIASPTHENQMALRLAPFFESYSKHMITKTPPRNAKKLSR